MSGPTAKLKRPGRNKPHFFSMHKNKSGLSGKAILDGEAPSSNVTFLYVVQKLPKVPTSLRLPLSLSLATTGREGSMVNFKIFNV